MAIGIVRVWSYEILSADPAAIFYVPASTLLEKTCCDDFTEDEYNTLIGPGGIWEGYGTGNNDYFTFKDKTDAVDNISFAVELKKPAKILQFYIQVSGNEIFSGIATHEDMKGDIDSIDSCGHYVSVSGSNIMNCD